MHTLSDIRCRGKYLLPNTCLRLNLDLIWFEFCDYQNIGLLRDINNIFKHYLYQQSPPFWWLQNLNSLNQKLIFKQVF